MMKYARMLRHVICLLALSAWGGAQAAPITAWTLPNGARVLFVESHAVPIVDVSVSLDAGARRDPLGQSGLAGMTCAMLSRGVAADAGQDALTEAQLSDAFADIAASADCSVEGDRAIVQLRTLSARAAREKAVALTARLLAQPRFPESLLDREKDRTMAGIRESDTRPGPVAHKAFMKALYGAHPYGQYPTVASIRQIGRDEVRAFHRQHYVASHAVIAIVGDVSQQDAHAMAEALTTRLPPSEKALPALPPVTRMKAQTLRLSHPASQAHILMGMPAMARGDKDYFAISVGNYILGGGGFASRLMSEVREKRGMAYSVRSGFTPMQQAGPFQIGLQTHKAQADRAMQVVQQTLDDFLRKGPTPAELKAAKDHLLGSFALNIDTNSKMLATVSVIAYYGLPLDYLETWQAHVAKVNADDVRRAFRRKLDAKQMTVVVVGSPE
jgi:zinc protease